MGPKLVRTETSTVNIRIHMYICTYVEAKPYTGTSYVYTALSNEHNALIDTPITSLCSLSIYLYIPHSALT